MPAVAPTYYRLTNPLGSSRPLEGLGVCHHYVGAVSALTAAQKAALADMGAKYLRTDLYWAEIETTKGVYNWAKYDAIVADLLSAGIRPFLIACYANPLYYTAEQIAAYNAQSGNPRPYPYGVIGPANDEQRAAYANFCAAAVERYKHKGVIWELWNEPNHPIFWGPKANAGDYVLMAVQAARAMRAVSPDEWIVGPALANFAAGSGYSGMDLPFLEQTFALGILEWIDGVSVHPYDSGDPASIEAALKAVRVLVDKYKPRRKTIHLLAGEVGWSDVWSGYAGRAPIPRSSTYEPTTSTAGVTNKLLYSNDFANTDWPGYYVKPTLTYGVADPFGGNNATRLAPADGSDGKSSGLLRRATLTVGDYYCCSIWVRSTSGPLNLLFGLNDNWVIPIVATERWQRFSAIGRVETGQTGRILQVVEGKPSNAAWEVFGAQAEAIPAPTLAQSAADRETLSADAVRSILVGAQAGGSRITMLYDLVEDGTSDTNAEHRFGLIRQDGTPKPAHAAVVGLRKAAAKWGA